MRAIGEELRREAAARGLRVHVALAGTRMAALVLVHAHPGLTLVEPGEEAEALAPLPIGILEKIPEAESLRSRPRECEAVPARGSLEPLRSAQALSNSAGGGVPSAAAALGAPGGTPARVKKVGAPQRHPEAESLGPRPRECEALPARGGGAPREVRNVSGLLELPELSVFRSWGIRTLGELAALPPADLAARLGPAGLVWQAIARGDDVRPLVPDVPEERFESSIELEWP